MSHTGSDVEGSVAILKDKQPLSIANIIDQTCRFTKISKTTLKDQCQGFVVVRLTYIILLRNVDLCLHKHVANFNVTIAYCNMQGSVTILLTKSYGLIRMYQQSSVFVFLKQSKELVHVKHVRLFRTSKEHKNCSRLN